MDMRGRLLLPRLLPILLLVILSLYGALILVKIPSQSILSVSRIYVEPTGWEDPNTHKWHGSYWVVLADTYTSDNILIYKFDEHEATQWYSDNTINGKKLVPKATIKISITKGMPYWSINLVEKKYMVYPKTYGTVVHVLTREAEKYTDVSVPELDCEVYELEGSWILHIPFKITVEVWDEDGNHVIKTKDIDVVGVEATEPIMIDFGNGKSLIVKLITQLSTGYGQPTWNDLIIFPKTLDVFKGSDVRNIIRYDASDYAYSCFWFGGGNIYKTENGDVVERWDDDGSPAFYVHVEGWGDIAVGDKDFAGNYRDDKWLDQYVLPIAGSIYDDPESEHFNPEDRYPHYSLLNYIKKYLKIDTVNLNLYGEGYDIDLDNKILKVYVPQGSVAWLFTIRISTELADTIVEQPVVGCGKIVRAYWLSTQSETTAFEDSDILVVEVRNTANATADITVDVESSDPSLLFEPDSKTVTIPSGESRTLQFKASNKGVSTKTKAVVSIYVKNTLGTVTDTAKVDCTLLPKSVEGGTKLNIMVVDASDLKPLTGIIVTIKYDDESKTGSTVDGRVSFNLANYQGDVEIYVSGAGIYQSAYKTVNVHLGENTVVIYLNKRISPESNIRAYLWIAIAVISSLAIVIIAYYLLVRKPR